MGTSLIRTPPLQDPTVALRLGTYGDPRGLGVSYERSTPAGHVDLRAAGGMVHSTFTDAGWVWST